jgi:hypothetical protein
MSFVYLPVARSTVSPTGVVQRPSAPILRPSDTPMS